MKITPVFKTYYKIYYLKLTTYYLILNLTSDTPYLKPAASDEHWDLVIQPKAHLFDLNLKEVWRYRDLLMLFVKRDFIAQYKQTILGPLWHLIQPVFTTIMFLLVFGKIANIPTDGVHPILFYMAGITIWNYFSSCLTTTSGTFVANAGIFGKVYFPRLVIPLSNVLSNMVKFAHPVSIIAGHDDLLFFQRISYSFWNYLAMDTGINDHDGGPGTGLGIIISSLTTKYRDLTVLISFAGPVINVCHADCISFVIFER